jgi:hypothetical protein
VKGAQIILWFNGNHASANWRIDWNMFNTANSCYNLAISQRESASEPAGYGEHFFVPIFVLPVAILTQSHLKTAVDERMAA